MLIFHFVKNYWKIFIPWSGKYFILLTYSTPAATGATVITSVLRVWWQVRLSFKADSRKGSVLTDCSFYSMLAACAHKGQSTHVPLIGQPFESKPHVSISCCCLLSAATALRLPAAVAAQFCLSALRASRGHHDCALCTAQPWWEVAHTLSKLNLSDPATTFSRSR